MATPDQDVRNRKLNPEARMELKEHLREFRDRFIKAAIATIIAAIIGTVFLYQPFIEMISAPLQQINAETTVPLHPPSTSCSRSACTSAW